MVPLDLRGSLRQHSDLTEVPVSFRSPTYAATKQEESLNMSSYKLTYFAVRARAESTRLAFAFGGVQYEDIRLGIGSEEWSKMKEGKHLSVWWAVVITIGFFRSNFLQTSGIIPER